METSDVSLDEPGKPKRALLKSVWLRFLIIAGLLNVGIWLYEAWEIGETYSSGGKAKVEEEGQHNGSIISPMQHAVAMQLMGIKAVNADALVNIYFSTLETTNCDWLFQCQPIYHKEASGHTGARTLLRASDAKLFYHPGWIIYIPTARTILGTPHALVEMLKAIWKAGNWAVAMYLSCTVIWAALILGGLRSELGAAQMLGLYLLIIGAPFGIAMMVSLVQWLGELALEGAGAALGLLVQVLAYSSALTVIAGVPHILRAPREIREAAETLKNIS